MTRHITYACDIGSTRANHGKRGNFGWVRVSERGIRMPQHCNAESLKQLCLSIQKDVRNGKHVSLGIEAPLFIPIPKLAEDLSYGRKGEGNRSCLAPTGSTVALLALHQMAWLFRELRLQIAELECTFDFEHWKVNKGSLLIWEAFISGKAHSRASGDQAHFADAYTAAELFRRYARDEHALDDRNRVMLKPGDVSFSVIGVALQFAGIFKDVQEIHSQKIFVMKAEVPANFSSIQKKC